MDEPKTRFDRYNLKIKNNPLIAILIIIGTAVIALSTFTDAAKNIWSFINVEKRPDINGEWIATVPYDWQNATYVEEFTFKGDDDNVHGTVSFLRINRSILEGKVEKNKLAFITKVEITRGFEESREVIYRYEGTISDDGIKFVLQIEGDFSTHIPIEFTAYRKANSSFESTKQTSSILWSLNEVVN